MNERSFIVKLGVDPASSVSEPGTDHSREHARGFAVGTPRCPKSFPPVGAARRPSVLRQIATGRVSGFSV